MKPFETIAAPGEFARAHLFHALLAGFEAPGSKFYFERNHYPAYEILYVTKGKAWFCQSGRWIQLMEGDCLIHDMRFPHAYKSDATEPYGMLYLVFDGTDIENLWKRLFHSPIAIVPSRPSSGCPIETNMLAVADWMKYSGALSDCHISSLIYELLVLIHHLSQFNDKKGAPQSDAIKEARAFMDSHYLNVREVKDVAAGANISVYHFIRQFKKSYGITPKEYLMMKKIQHAKRLLLVTNLSVTEIAAQSGFANYNTFLHAFNKMEQCSPLVYRKNWQRRSF